MNEIIIYQSDNTSLKLPVRVEQDTVWLSLNQISELFQRDKSVISRHIRNVFKEKELLKEVTVANNATVKFEGGKEVIRQIDYYNLDVIISVGYRVKSLQGTQFRIWANAIIKDFLLKGHALSHRIDSVERKLNEHDEKFNLLLKTSLPVQQGIFFDGQVFDAYTFVSDIIRSAKVSIVIIDNYIDDTVLTHLNKREKGVSVIIYTKRITKALLLDIAKHNEQYDKIKVKEFSNAHDRFVIIDETLVYHIGASLKDLGKKWFAFSKMEIDAKEIIDKISDYQYRVYLTTLHKQYK